MLSSPEIEPYNLYQGYYLSYTFEYIVIPHFIYIQIMLYSAELKAA